MPILLFVAFVVVPVAELYVIVKVGEAIGVVPTLALLVLDAVVGAALMRREGRRTWIAFRRALSEGRVPGREVADGGLVLFGGALMIAPGFLTDVLGIACVLPPTRAAIRRIFLGRLTRRLSVRVGPRRPQRRRDPGRAAHLGSPAQPGGPAQPDAHEVIDGELGPPR